MISASYTSRLRPRRKPIPTQQSTGGLSRRDTLLMPYIQVIFPLVPLLTPHSPMTARQGVASPGSQVRKPPPISPFPSLDPPVEIVAESLPCSAFMATTWSSRSFGAAIRDWSMVRAHKFNFRYKNQILHAMLFVLMISASAPHILILGSVLWWHL